MKKIISVVIIVIMVMCMSACSDTTNDTKNKAESAMSGAANTLQGIAEKVTDKMNQIQENQGDSDVKEIQPVKPDVSTESEVVGAGSDFISQLNDFVYNMTEQYPNGQVTVDDVLNGVQGDDLMTVIQDILTDPMDVPDGEKSEAIVQLDELIQKLQDVANEMIGGINKPQAR